MNKDRLKGLVFLASVLLILRICPALAASPVLSLCYESEGTEIAVRLVETKEKRDYVLYLPGAFGDREPTIRIDQDTDLIWDGTTYPNGGTLPVSRYVGRKISAKFANGRLLGDIQVMRGSAIPSLFFTVTANDLNRVTVNQKRDIKEPAGMVMVRGDGSLNADERLTSFKVRGNSTYFASKKSYTFKMTNKQDLGGMGRNKKWILLANWFDISLIRNQITYDLCRELGLTATPDCRQAEVYINGKYNGTYLMTEKIQLKKHRLEITDLEEQYEALLGQTAYEKAKRKKGSSNAIHIFRYFNQKAEPEDLTGGYLLEIEKPLHFSIDEESAGFVTDGDMCVTVKEPTYAGKEAVLYIAGVVNDFHNAVLSKDGVNKKTGKYYTDYIDLHSFAAKVAIEEFTANYDVQAASHFMYKDSDRVDSLLYCGPGWDYDLTYGNKDDGMRNPAKLDYIEKRANTTAFLYRWLLTHEDFRQATRKVLVEELQPASEILLGRREPPEGSQLKSIAAYQAEIADSAAMNFTRWNPRGVPDITDASGRSFEDAGAYVTNWVQVRTETLMEGWLK